MKKMTLILWMGLSTLLLVLIVQECMAGIVIEQLVRESEGIASKVFLYFSENRFRTDHPENGLTMMMDFKDDRMIMIDHRSKRYVQIRFSQWEKEVAQSLKKENPSVTPKNRQIIVKKDGETLTINGFRTEKIQIFADGELIEEDWVTRDVNIKEVEKVMEKVARGFSKEFRFEMKEGREIYEKVKPYGFPILVKDYTASSGLRPVDVIEVKKMEKKELGDEIFLPPAGYERVVPKPAKK